MRLMTWRAVFARPYPDQLCSERGGSGHHVVKEQPPGLTRREQGAEPAANERVRHGVARQVVAAQVELEIKV